MPSSKIDKAIIATKRRIQCAKDQGIETAGLEAQLRKLEVKKQINKGAK